MAKKKATPKEKKLSPESEASLNDTLKEDNSGNKSKNAGAAAVVSVIEAVTEPNPAKAAEEIKPESPTPVKEKIPGDSGASTEEVKSAADNIATIEESAPTEGAPIDDNKVFVHLNNNSNMQNQPIGTWPPMTMLPGCHPTTVPHLCINTTVTIQTGCQPPCVNTTVDSRPGDWTTIFGKCPTMHPGCGPAQQLPQSIGCVVTHNAPCPPVTNYHTCHPCHTAAIGCPNTSTCAANANNTDTLISRMPCPTAIPACHHSGHHHCHHTRHHHCNHTHLIGCPNTSTCSPNANADTILSKMPCPSMDCQTRPGVCVSLPTNCPTVTTCEHTWNCGGGVSRPTICPTVCDCPVTWNCQKSEVLSCNPCPTVQTCGPVSAHPCPSTADCNANAMASAYPCPTVATCPPTWNCPKSEVLSCHPCPSIPCPTMPGHCYSVPTNCPTVTTCEHTWNCDSKAFSCNPCPTVQPCQTLNSPGGNNAGGGVSLPTICPTVCACPHTWNCESKMFSCNPCPTVANCPPSWNCGGDNAGGGVSRPTICPTVCDCPVTWNCQKSEVLSCNPCPTVQVCHPTWNCESKMFSCHPCPSVPCPSMPGHCVSIPTNCPTVTTCEHTWNCDSKAFSCNPCPTVQHCPPPTLDCPGGNNDGGGVSLPTICPTVCTCPPTWNCDSKMFSCNPCPTVQPCPHTWNCDSKMFSCNPCPTVQHCPPPTLDCPGGNNDGGGVSLPTICPTVCTCPPTWNCDSKMFSCNPCPTVATCPPSWNCGGNNAGGGVSLPTICPTVCACPPSWNCPKSEVLSCYPCPSVPCPTMPGHCLSVPTNCPTVTTCEHTWNCGGANNANGIVSVPTNCPTVTNCHPTWNCASHAISCNPCPSVQPCGPLSHNPCPTVQPCHRTWIDCTIINCPFSHNPCPTVQPCYPSKIECTIFPCGNPSIAEICTTDINIQHTIGHTCPAVNANAGGMMSANPCPTVQPCHPVSANPCPTVQPCHPVSANPCPTVQTCGQISHNPCPTVQICGPVTAPPCNINSHLVICPPSHLVICPPSHLVMCPPSHLVICPPSHFVICPPQSDFVKCQNSDIACFTTNVNTIDTVVNPIGLQANANAASPTTTVLTDRTIGGCLASAYPCGNTSIPGCGGEATWLTGMHNCHSRFCSEIGCPVSVHPCPSVVCSKVGCPVSVHPCPSVATCYDNKTIINTITDCYTGPTMCPPSVGCPPQANANANYSGFATICSRINCPISFYPCQPISANPCPTVQACGNAEAQKQPIYGPTGWHTCTIVSANPCPSTHGCESVQVCPTIYTQINCPIGVTGWYTCTPVSQHPCPSTHECPSVQVICPTTHTQINCPIGYTGWYTCIQVSHQPCPSTHGCPTVEPCITTAPPQANANANYSGIATVCTQLGCPPGYTGWHTCTIVSANPCPSNQGCDSVQVCSTTHTQIECPPGYTGWYTCVQVSHQPCPSTHGCPTVEPCITTAPQQANANAIHSGAATVCTQHGCPIGITGWYTCGQVSHQPCPSTQGCDSVQVCSTTHTQIECPVGPTGMENCKTAPVQHSGPETVCTLTPGCHVSKMGCGFSHASCETIEGCHPTAIDCNPHGTGMHTADICMTEFMCHTIHICEMETTVLSVVPCPSVADCPSIADCPTIGDCGGGENPAEKAE